MANGPAPALVLRDGDRDRLTSLSRSPSVRADLVLRAKIVLLAADGVANTEIALRLGCARQTVLDWRARYGAGGIGGLNDEPRPGRARTVDRAAIIAATLSPPPKKLGVTHWSSRLLAAHLGMAQTAIVRAWRDYGVAPWRAGTFTFSTDPELVAKVTDVVGLYLAPPENGILLCVDGLRVDEKSQIQALDRTAPLLPMKVGSPEQRTHDYVHHGITTPQDRPLFAAPEVATGKVTARVQPRHRHQEFLRFRKQVEKAYPDDGSGLELHLVLDNYAAHKRIEVRDWLAANPRVKVHFTPTSGSWLKMVETWFSIIEHQAIRRGTFRSVRELNAKIRTFIDG